MKKILFVGAYPPPYGGIASHLHDLLPRLSEYGFEIVLLTLDQQSEAQQPSSLKRIFVNTKEYFTKNRVKILFAYVRSFRHKKEMERLDFLRVVTQATAIHEVAEQAQVDGVFLYDNYNGFVIPMLKQYNKARALVLMIFGDFYLFPKKYTALSRYMYNVFRHTDMILSSSNYCANSITSVMGFNFPVQVIYVGVDHNEYAKTKGMKLRTRFGIPPSAVVFSFLGRMNKSMGMDFVLEIATKLLDIGEDVYLLLAGARGDLSHQVEKLALDHPRVRVSTDIPFADKPDFYGASDVFMAPTMEKHACMGVSIKEAMACGKPIIASNSGGIPEAIEDGVNGFLIPINCGEVDEAVFLGRAERLLRDRVLREDMGKHGRRKVLKLFTNDETVQRYLGLIKVLEQRSH